MMETFIMTDQPVVCPFCGARAEIILEFTMQNLSTQLCKCPDSTCQSIFIEQEEIRLT